MPEAFVLQAGRSVEVAEGQTVLAAALDAGIPYPHGCRSGRCGTCKSRLAAGEVDLLPHSRFALSAEERAAGLVLACRAVPRTDVAVAWLGGEEDAPAHPLRRARARVVAVEDLTHDIRGLRLGVEGEPLAFSAGQHARLRLPGLPARDYSMAGLPGDPVLEFHVRRVPGGALSEVLHRLRVGDLVEVEGPQGGSHLRAGGTGPILTVAGGSGLAPILSVAGSAVALGMRQPIRLYHGVREGRDLYAAERLAALAAAHPDLMVVPVASREGGLRVHQRVAADLPSLRGWTAYVAGPPGMVDAVAEAAVAAGLDPADLHADAFFTPEADAPAPILEGSAP